MSIDQIINLLLVVPGIKWTFRQIRQDRLAQRQAVEMDLENQNEVKGNGATNAHNPILIVDDRDRAIRQYVVPLFNELNLEIRRLKIEAPEFKLKLMMFQMLQTIAGVIEGTLRLKLFPYSLQDTTQQLLNFLPPSLISTWQELAELFLVKYFPSRKNVKLQNEITTFQQMDDESLYEAWKRFKELLCKCPHHEIPHCIQLETFTRMVVDASANGALLFKSYNEAYKIIERIASNNYQWPKNRAPSGRQVAGVHEVDALTSLSAQVSFSLQC
ncbi:Retrotransposon gag protein [Gossypium australe]|uniref:Retrotransposon gag protein n=1 Tax=Gossypium australe TaxID=47621 RepID=A0A5B6W819_9ROSI|nr:Retrotransposon gag protein [Gossypium australe]